MGSDVRRGNQGETLSHPPELREGPAGKLTPASGGSARVLPRWKPSA